MTNTNFSQLIFKLLWVLWGLSLSLIIATVFSFWLEKQQQVQAAKTNARSEARRAAQKIDRQLSQLKNTGLAIANKLNVFYFVCNNYSRSC